ncbi:MAG: hypothetical protein PVH07_10570 [Chloroflexota bacterium]|jgi:hypothetical protein
MGVTTAPTDWLLEPGEPWTRYRTLLDLEARPPDDPELVHARATMVAAEPVQTLITRAGEWPGHPLKRHNDASHPLYALATLADFGLGRDDARIESVADRVLAHFDGEGFETLLWLPRFLTRETEDAERWAWMLCDAPTLLYVLLCLGYGDDARVRAAVEALAGRVRQNGWRCGASSSLPRFSGPGRKDDPCPMATTYALKALAESSHRDDEAVVGPGIVALLDHWQHQRDEKLRMFGIGTEFRKLRYPFVWYDLLHVADVLSRYPMALADPRFEELRGEIAAQADSAGRYRAGAMYRAWQGWSFADKRQPSPWLTFLVLRIEARQAAA